MSKKHLWPVFIFRSKFWKYVIPHRIKYNMKKFTLVFIALFLFFGCSREELVSSSSISEGAYALRPELDENSPMIALTFDDGPSATTEKILDLLKENNARATFCVVGNRIEKYEDTVTRIVTEGNEIACHTWSHVQLSKMSEPDAEEQIMEVNEAVKKLTGFEIRFLRPPYGKVNESILAAAAAQNNAVVCWSVDTLDWKTKNPSYTLRSIKNGACDGAIILCHDLYKETGTAMETAIPWLKKQGYELVTVSELVYYKLGSIEAGALYKSLS